MSRKSIQTYLQQAFAKEKEDHDLISKCLQENQSQIVVWGAGAYAMQLIKNMPDLEKRIEFFVDSNKTKVRKTLLGRMIFEPDKLIGSEQSYPILICSTAHHSEDIVSTIQEMGIRNPYLIA